MDTRIRVSKEKNAQIVCLSALLTTTMPMMKQTVKSEIFSLKKWGTTVFLYSDRSSGYPVPHLLSIVDTYPLVSGQYISNFFYGYHRLNLDDKILQLDFHLHHINIEFV